jgi:thiamine pyrophosphate-dependent acetolactate synthase large subunit-like protein
MKVPARSGSGGNDHLEASATARVTKHIPRLVAQAARVATSAPMLDLPMDVLSSPVNDESAPTPRTIRIDSALPPGGHAVPPRLVF